MCFSAEASFIAGVSLSAASVVTLRMVRDKNEIPLALVPLVFGIQQLIEGVVWVSFHLDAPLFNSVMTNLYLFFARVVWPIFFLMAIGRVEYVPWRKNVLFVFALMGTITGAYFLYAMLLYPLTSSVVKGHIVYSSSHFPPDWLYFFFLYVVATTVSCLFSSHRIINIMGVLLLVFGFITYWLYAISFASIWCFFAAVISSVVYLHFYFLYRVVPPAAADNSG